MADKSIRNEYGEVVFLSDPPPPATETLHRLTTPQQVANAHVRALMGDMNLRSSSMEEDMLGAPETVAGATPMVTFSSEKDIAGAKVVVYKQLILGLEIFEATMGVQMDSSSLAVQSVQSSMHAAVSIENANQKEITTGERKVSKPALKKMLGIELPNMKNGVILRQVIYRYEPDAREEEHIHHEGCIGTGHLEIPHLPDPSLAGLAKGNHYVVDEVLFEASRTKGEPPVNWRALVEPESGEVLYLRALVGCATGLVYDRDPQTQGGATVTGASPNATLNPYRSSMVLQGLISSNPQQLTGQYVKVMDTQAPTIAPPTKPNPPAVFNYDVRTDDFSAVNAYYHCDRMFRTMANYGFNVSTYFGGTSFPVPVDHRALGNTVNAQAPGNIMGNGLKELRFALLQSGQPVGIATSNRVVWHEFGHALLWDHVNSPNFGFAHSAGDTLAAVLNDPGTLEADRFDTFPWVQQATPIGRRHDRTVAAGWAWFGPQYNTQYNGEQILCTTMFRFYNSIGGGSPHLGTQKRAAKTTAYLVMKAIGFLTSTTAYPNIYEAHLENADKTTTSFKGIPGGALHKVIRWAFEKQGLFQPAAAPGQGNNVNSEGNPPNVDVYIDDGRGGEYTYLANHWSCQDMWVRRTADGGMSHQHPLVGLTNYMYVRVKNRGLQTAENVSVDAYHALPGTGLAFPDDWAAMNTASLPASGPIASGGSTIVGPFAFVPTQVGHECLLAIARADGDEGNDTTLMGTIPENRLVPFDNNIGQRNVNPVLPTFRWILRLFEKHVIWVRNPLRIPVVCHIDVRLPMFMRRLGWKLHVKSEGGQKFEMAPRDKRKVVLVMEAGEELRPEMVKEAIARGDALIELRTYLNDELSGGMSYPLSFDADDGKDRPVDPDKPRDDRDDRDDRRPVIISRRSTIEEILKILGRVGADRPIRTVRIELDLDDES